MTDYPCPTLAYHPPRHLSLSRRGSNLHTTFNPNILTRPPAISLPINTLHTFTFSAHPRIPIRSVSRAFHDASIPVFPTLQAVHREFEHIPEKYGIRYRSIQGGVGPEGSGGRDGRAWWHWREELGSPGASCRRRSKGGKTRATQLGHEGYAEMGKKGGLASNGADPDETAEEKNVDIDESKFTK